MAGDGLLKRDKFWSEKSSLYWVTFSYLPSLHVAKFNGHPSFLQILLSKRAEGGWFWTPGSLLWGGCEDSEGISGTRYNGGSRRGTRGTRPPLFSDQTRARTAEKIFSGNWPPPPPPPSLLLIWGRFLHAGVFTLRPFVFVFTLLLPGEKFASTDQKHYPVPTPGYMETLLVSILRRHFVESRNKGDIGGSQYRLQYRNYTKKNWKIPNYLVGNRPNTDTPFMIGHAYLKL